MPGHMGIFINVHKVIAKHPNNPLNTNNQSKNLNELKLLFTMNQYTCQYENQSVNMVVSEHCSFRPT